MAGELGLADAFFGRPGLLTRYSNNGASLGLADHLCRDLGPESIVGSRAQSRANAVGTAGNPEDAK